MRKVAKKPPIVIKCKDNQLKALMDSLKSILAEALEGIGFLTNRNVSY